MGADTVKWVDTSSCPWEAQWSSLYWREQAVCHSKAWENISLLLVAEYGLRYGSVPA